MMEFERKNDQIYANYCFRLGKVLEQYEGYVKEKKYEVTLIISILQSVAVGFVEYWKKMVSKSDLHIFSEMVDHCGWGLEKTLKSTLEEEHTLRDYIAHIRNALSHPIIYDKDSDYPDTGFISVGKTESIEDLIFIDSPDVFKDSKIKSRHSVDIKRRLKGLDKRQVEDFKSRKNDFRCVPSDVYLMDQVNGKYLMYRDGKPYIRMTKIKLSTGQLRLFVYNLINILVQPNNQDWDYKTIVQYFPPAA